MDEFSGELIKINRGGFTKREANIDTSVLELEDLKWRYPDLRKGFQQVYLTGEKSIPAAGRYFVKESPTTEEEKDLDAMTSTNGEKIEHLQLLRYHRLKEGGARVPNTFRKYIDKDGKGYYVITDLSQGGKDFVWSPSDTKEIPVTVTQQIKWEELADDIIKNSLLAARSNVWCNFDAHLIVISGEHAFDYMADLDKAAQLYDVEQGCDVKKDDVIVERDGIPTLAIEPYNVYQGWLNYQELLKRTGNHEIEENSTKFWKEVRKNYQPDEWEKVKFKLLRRSMIDPKKDAVAAGIIEKVFTQRADLDNPLKIGQVPGGEIGMKIGPLVPPETIKVLNPAQVLDLCKIETGKLTLDSVRLYLLNQLAIWQRREEKHQQEFEEDIRKKVPFRLIFDPDDDRRKQKEISEIIELFNRGDFASVGFYFLDQARNEYLNSEGLLSGGTHGLPVLEMHKEKVNRKFKSLITSASLCAKAIGRK